MRFVRFLTPAGPRWGRAETSGVVELDGAPYLGGAETGITHAPADLQLLAPVEPSKIICIGRNYADHAAELGNQAPSEPMFFLKPPSALAAPDQAIELPDADHTVHWEAELAVIVGWQARNLPEAEAMDCVFGYTIANDVSDRDFQKSDAPFGFGRGKCFDTFLPCGPAVVTAGVDPLDVHMTLSCNGLVRQSDSTALMLHKVPRLIASLSAIMTLMPGDLILTGTPKGVGPMKRGDLIEISIPGIGTLSNSVR